jgi:hypothetical protein
MWGLCGLGSLLPVLVGLLAVCSGPDLARAAFVYESPSEFFTSGDFNGDGLADVIVVDKLTGNARVGYSDGLGNLAWSPPLLTGVDNVSGCAVGHFKQTAYDTLVVTATSLNRVQLYDLSHTNAAASLGASTQSGIGPHSLAALASPFGSPPPPFSTLLIASSQNDNPAERLDIVTNFPIGFASSAGQFAESGSFERASELPLSSIGPSLAAGLVRGATNDALHLWQFTNSPSVMLVLSNLPPGSDYAFGVFNGESLPRFICYQRGGTNLSIYPLIQSGGSFLFGSPTSVTVSEPVQQVYYLQLGADGSALLVFSDGVQGLRLPGGVATLSAKYSSGTGAAGNVPTGIVPLPNGLFALFDAPPGGPASVHGQVLQFDGTSFTQLSAANLPNVSTRSTRANVWLFQLEPFVHRDAGFIASVSAPDWSDSVTGLPAALNAATESDGGTNTGLGGIVSSSLGAPPSGATNGLPNQYHPAISLFSYSPPRAPEPASILISPPPGPYGAPIPVSFTWPGSSLRVFYRVTPGGTWQSYAAPFQLTNDATVEYYGSPLLSPARSQIQLAAYTIGNPPTSGTNSPINVTPGNTNTVVVLSTNQLSISPDGTVFYGRVSAANNYSIWAINLDGSSDTFVTTGARPRVSSDGRYLAFLRGGTPLVTQGNVYVRDLQTSQESLLYSNTSYTIGYDWDLTQTNLVFDWSCWLWSIGVGGGTGAVLPLPAPDCYDDAPVVNPVEGSVAFHNLDPDSSLSGLYVTSPDRTSKTRLVTSVPGASWPAWSPDGTWLAFADGNSASSAFSADAGTNLWVVRGDGTDLTQISGFTDGMNHFPHGALWTPDSSGLVGAGTVFGTNGLWLIPLTPDYLDCDGPPILLPTSPGDAIDFAGSIVVAPTPLVVLTQAPGLFIRQTPGAVVVYWNTNFAGYTLESKPDVSTSGWAPVAGPYFLDGSYFEHWELRSALAPQEFFRLHYTGAFVLSQPPLLTITLQGNNVLLTWPSTFAGFTLQTKSDPAAATSWNDLPGPYAASSGNYQYQESLNSAGARFFRLRGP